MVSDNSEWRTYAAAMAQDQPFIRLKLNTEQPIELGEFVSAFTAIAAEYDRFIRSTKPDIDPSATLFVRDVRAGCIEAALIPWLVGYAGVSTVMLGLQHANTVGEFVERYGKYLGLYKPKGGKLAGATASQLRDFSDQVAAIANCPNSALEVAAIEIRNGEEVIRQAFRFDTQEAQAIKEHVDEHRRELEAKSDGDHPRVLMVFTRPDIGKAKLGKRSGELVRIDSILTDRSLPLIYAADLAEQRIKHEIANAEFIFKKGFVVDVNVELLGGKPIAYRVTHVHQVIDLPDDEEPERR